MLLSAKKSYRNLPIMKNSIPQQSANQPTVSEAQVCAMMSNLAVEEIELVDAFLTKL